MEGHGQRNQFWRMIMGNVNEVDETVELTLHHVEIRRIPGLAVYVDVFLQGSNGNVYKIHAGAFEFDLELSPNVVPDSVSEELEGA